MFHSCFSRFFFLSLYSKNNRMMRTRQLFIAFMLFCLLPLVSWADIYTDPTTGVRYSYTVGETTASVTNSNPKPGAINILSSFTVGGNTYTVTSIGEQAFYSYPYLTSVTIPNSVTSIGDEAFSGCNALTSVNIPNSVTSIGEVAFLECSALTSVTIPNSVTSIGIAAFALCTGLTEIYSYIENPFDIAPNCWAQVDKNIPLYVPKGTKAKYRMLDGWYEFTNIMEIDNNIKFADDYVKALCVKNWDTDGDREISFDEAAAVKELGEVFWGKKYVTSFNELKYFKGLTSIGEGAFSDCGNLTSIIIPQSVTSIGEAAFNKCNGLTSIIIPQSVTIIGETAFSECNALTSITVESGNSFFDSRDNCNAVITRDNVLIVGCKNTIIPNSVTRIGNYAFAVCSGLTSITIPNSVTGIGVWAFGGSGLTSINIPNSVAYIHDGAFAFCSNLSSITVESGNSKFDSRDNCNAIIETNTNTLIAGCKNTIIPNTVTSIGTSAFRGCEGLTSITIPNTVTSIGDFAFFACTGFTNFTIPNAVTNIGQYAFCDCLSLTSITIPNSVTSIGGYAFFDCIRLTEIYSYIEEPFSPGVNCWYNTNKSIPLYVPVGTKAKYEATDGWKDFKTILEIGTSLAEIDETSTATPEAVNNAYVTVKRTINADEWSTLCLPFAMSVEQVTTAFGEDVKLGDCAGCEVNGDHITAKFDKATSIAANHPYIIKVSTSVSEFTVEGVDVVPAAAEVKKNESGGKCNSFIGNYVNGLTLDDGTLFLYGNSFWFSNGNTKMKGLRGYFKFDAAGVSYSSSSRISIQYDEATGISDTKREVTAGGRYYNLSGQQVDTPTKGIYVRNGKKVIIK